MTSKKMQKPQLSHYLLFAYRIAILYVLMIITRIVFYAFNADLFSDISFGDFMTILRGGLKFDTTAIIYLNIVFIAMMMFTVIGAALTRKSEENGMYFFIMLVYIMSLFAIWG